jgi:hypothetical protein
LNLLIRDYLESIEQLSGDEYLLRAMTYTKTLIPPEKRNEMKVLTLLSEYTNREEIRIAKCRAMTKELFS